MPRAPQRSQFGDPQLTPAEAMSACGPAAALAFARVNGRTPTLREAVDLAKSVGWSADRGMAGPASERALLQKMGIDADLSGGADPTRVRADVQGGKPVIVSTGLHYFTLSDYDPQSDRYYVGTSGTDLKNGREWMSLDDIDRASKDRGYGGINGALHMTAAPVGATAERQRFLEENAPGESGTTTSTSSLQTAEGAQRSGGVTPRRDPLADLPTTGGPPASAAAAVGEEPADREALRTDLPDWLKKLQYQDAYSRHLMGQVGEAPAMPGYQLPGVPALPEWRPSKFRLPRLV